jgi:DNA replication protein DnaC
MLRASPARDRRFIRAGQLAVARIQNGAGQGEAHLVDLALACELLVLDDVGSESRVPSSAVADVIAERHDAMRPTIITTWLTADDVARDARYGEGIARRIFEESAVIVPKGTFGFETCSACMPRPSP